MPYGETQCKISVMSSQLVILFNLLQHSNKAHHPIRLELLLLSCHVSKEEKDSSFSLYNSNGAAVCISLMHSTVMLS